jgi:glutaredoxin 3
MPKITIYTTPFCGFCHAAKALLKRKGAAFDEIDVSGNPAERQTMTALANGRRTVPQIFIGTRHIGGYDELSALDRDGALDALLAAT